VSGESYVERPPRVSARELEGPPDLTRRRLRSRLLFVVAILVAVAVVVTVLPGLESLRSRLAGARPGWLCLGAALKLASGLAYVVVFRSVFCRQLRWRTSYEIGMSELGANALFPTGGAGGLALGAWALRRGGMSGRHIARRTVAFFLLTSLPNVLGVIILGIGLALGAFAGKASLALTLIPAAAGIIAIAATLAVGRLAARAHGRLARRETTAAGHARALAGALAEGVSETLMLLRRGDAALYLGLIGYLAFDVMVLWATFHAFGHSPELAILWLAYLIGELGGLIPLPGGIGGVDAGLVGTFVLYGTSLSAATAAVLAYRAIALWVPAIFGGAAFLMLRRTLRDEADQLAVCAPGSEVEIVGVGRAIVEH
jgi:uncharacterized protein (TIRG00374 family)